MPFPSILWWGGASSSFSVFSSVEIVIKHHDAFLFRLVSASKMSSITRGQATGVPSSNLPSLVALPTSRGPQHRPDHLREPPAFLQQASSHYRLGHTLLLPVYPFPLMTVPSSQASLHRPPSSHDYIAIVSGIKRRGIFSMPPERRTHARCLQIC